MLWLFQLNALKKVGVEIALYLLVALYKNKINRLKHSVSICYLLFLKLLSNKDGMIVGLLL